MVTKTEYADKGNLNEYPWNLKGCTSAVKWEIPDDPELGPGDGTIEVYETAALSKTRRDWEVAISSFFPANKYYLQVENVLLQVPKTLSLQEAAQYKLALEKMATGEQPDSYTPD